MQSKKDRDFCFDLWYSLIHKLVLTALASLTVWLFLFERGKNVSSDSFTCRILQWTGLQIVWCGNVYVCVCIYLSLTTCMSVGPRQPTPRIKRDILTKGIVRYYLPHQHGLTWEWETSVVAIFFLWDITSFKGLCFIYDSLGILYVDVELQGVPSLKQPESSIDKSTYTCFITWFRFLVVKTAMVVLTYGWKAMCVDAVLAHITFIRTFNRLQENKKRKI